MRHKLLITPIVRYILAGVLAYTLELSVLLALHKLFGFTVELSTALAFWVGLTSSFLLQKLLAFQDYQKEIKAISKQVGAYIVLVLINYAFTLSIVALFPSRLIIFSRTLALVITTLWNYFIYKKIIFKKTNTSRTTPSTSWNALIRKTKSTFISKRFLLFLALSSVVIVFFWQYISTGNNKTLGGDFDYYSQMYEAMRISILKFHQFPLWNPWLSGGIPLFANPQFGLFSIQSVFALLFGAIYGLKLASIVYALLGFWGMFFLGKRVLKASKLRSALVGLIWVFNGFFAGHGVWHFTFTSFFLLPWLVYFIAKRKEKYSWLWLGIVQSILILSSIHYAFLMMTLMVAIFFVLILIDIKINKDKLNIQFNVFRHDSLFVLKSLITVVVLAGYQFIVTYRFVSHNQRLINDAEEIPPTLGLLLKEIFLPIGTIIHKYPKTSWGWGEYSMYIGVGTGLALVLCLSVIVVTFLSRRKKITIRISHFTWAILGIGLLGLLFALGNFARFSPFHLLHILPGFTQTRVPSRWAIFTVFSILIFILAWKPNRKIINFLLLLSVIELFVSFNTNRLNDSWFVLPTRSKSVSSFSQYDDNHQHLAVNGDVNIYDSYYLATSLNKGQIYADDSLINTLSDTAHNSKTVRCGQNTQPDCSFILTKNAIITYWSPNKIILKRTKPGKIELNMNLEGGWRINGSYPYGTIKKLDPSASFYLPGNLSEYTLKYAPKLSPAWLMWRIQKL